MGSLLLFILASVASVVVFRQAGRVKKEHRRVKAGGYHPGAPLDPYSLAFLAGGPRRVVNTAVAVLVSQGRVRISRDGTVTAVRGIAGAPAERIEQEVLDLAAGTNGRSLADIRRTATVGPAVTGIDYGLRGQGLVVADSALSSARRATTKFRWLAALAGLFVPISIITLAAGLYDFVVWNVLALVLSLVTWISTRVMKANYARENRSVLTEAGHAALRAAQARHPKTRELAYAHNGGNDSTLALYGMAFYVGPGHAELQNAGGCGAGACGGPSGADSGWGSGSDFGGGDFGGGGGDSGGGDSGGGSSCGGGGCGGGCGGS
ncbi:TIGR04222 domain-containing membrane protein [Herbidospora sp. NEAU-GS84]|uniref:TIGR04222 domain-containing membrane protein n=1 Tax=Herbidospora solisilvae TaxID=2696284 RepID=A0A7C9NMX0_9ACTN|nr:TIGR04222 domain-containing membrane protein [Herbidospora solisilvae]NAS26712.1 TIGR04222 domain-containing membrane protein [Herbidospora solisilvae]